MKTEDVRDFLKQRQLSLSEDRIQNATRLRGPDGEIFCIYDSGKFVPQGNRKSALAVAVEEWVSKGAAASGGLSLVTESTDAPVFIVYGHDTAARDNLELLLMRMGLLAQIAATRAELKAQLQEALTR